MQQIDVKNAFINGYLYKEIYMKQSPGFESSDKTQVCKLNRAMYGLQQVPRAWYERITQQLIKFGFTASKYDHSLIITGSSSKLISDLITKLNKSFALKELGALDYFMGIEVKKIPNGSLLMTQSKYIRDLMQRANRQDCKGIATPMLSNLKLSKCGSDILNDPNQYRSIVGALQYVTLTRP